MLSLRSISPLPQPRKASALIVIGYRLAYHLCITRIKMSRSDP